MSFNLSKLLKFLLVIKELVAEPRERIIDLHKSGISGAIFIQAQQSTSYREVKPLCWKKGRSWKEIGSRGKKQPRNHQDIILPWPGSCLNTGYHWSSFKFLSNGEAVIQEGNICSVTDTFKLKLRLYHTTKKKPSLGMYLLLDEQSTMYRLFSML